MNNATGQTVSHSDRLQNFERNSRTLASSKPTLMEAFWRLHKKAVVSDALDTKTKELIALAVSVATRCDDCISHHTYDALEAGATREEIADALGVAILMCGGTGVVYASHAIEAVDQFLERGS